MESLWRQQAGLLIPKYHENLHAIRESHWDVVVIGAGMAGILTAYFLQKQGKRVLIVEAKSIASGQTERTTAKITSQHGIKYAKMLREIGEEKARKYAQANELAIAQYERLIKEERITCGFRRLDAYLYSTKDEKSLKEEAKVAEKLGIDAEYTAETKLPFPVAGAVKFAHQAQFFPLEFLKHIVKELNVLEHTLVTELKESWVITNKGILTADDIVITTHYPIWNVPGFYFLRQHQERSYVLALKGTEPMNAMYYGIDEDGLSFRQAGNYLLLGGSNHRTGEVYRSKEGNGCKGAYENLRRAANRYFPGAKEVATWSAQDCITHDGIPFIGKYSVFTPHWYVATGFQKWGMSTSMVAAKMICDMISGKENSYADVFTPQRMLIQAGYREFCKDAGISTINLTKGIVSKKTCSHMGCALKWNPDTKSWDCPCHGSRFEKSGELLDNPAKKNLNRNDF